MHHIQIVFLTLSSLFGVWCYLRLVHFYKQKGMSSFGLMLIVALFGFVYFSELILSSTVRIRNNFLNGKIQILHNVG